MSGGKKFIDALQVGTVDTTFDPNRGLWVNNNVSPALLNPNGSFNAPFATIQAALNALGAPASPTDQFAVPAIFIVNGIYDEDLVIPNYRSVEFIALGLVGIGNSNRTITIALSGAPPASTDAQITFNGGSQQNMIVLGRIVLTSDFDHVLELQLIQTKINASGVGAIAGIDASGFVGAGGAAADRELRLSFSDCTINGGGGGNSILGDATAAVLLGSCQNTQFSDPLTVDSYDHFIGCYFEDKIEMLVVPNTGSSGGLSGFYSCGFANSGVEYDGGPGAPGEFVIDAATNYNFINTSVPGSLTNATKAVTDATENVIGVWPANGSPIPVDKSYSFVVSTAGAGENRGLPDPTFLGQQLTFRGDAATMAGGSDTNITSGGTLDSAGNSVVNFSAAVVAPFAKLEAVAKNAGIIWQVVQADGATVV